MWGGQKKRASRAADWLKSSSDPRLARPTVIHAARVVPAYGRRGDVETQRYRGRSQSKYDQRRNTSTTPPHPPTDHLDTPVPGYRRGHAIFLMSLLLLLLLRLLLFLLFFFPSRLYWRRARCGTTRTYSIPLANFPLVTLEPSNNRLDTSVSGVKQDRTRHWS